MNMYADDIRIYKGTPAWELAKCVENEDTAEIMNLTKKDTSLVNFVDPKFGQTLLYWAVYTHHLNSANALLQSQSDPNRESFDGTTPFIMACYNPESSDYLNLLLKYGGDVNYISPIKEYEGKKTPLIAASYFNLENVKILVESGAKIDYVSEGYMSALYAACVFYRVEIVKYLVIEQHADFNVSFGKDNEGHTLFLIDYLKDMKFTENQKHENEIKEELIYYIENHGI